MKAESIPKTRWLTNFCNSLRLFVAIVMIQIVVFIYALNFISFDLVFVRKLSVLSLLAQLVERPDLKIGACKNERIQNFLLLPV